MNTYFKFKIATEFIIPIVIVVLIVIRCTISSCKEEKIKKYMINHGYNRYISGNSSYGNKVWYKYKKGDDIISEDDLFKMKFKDVKKKYK